MRKTASERLVTRSELLEFLKREDWPARRCVPFSLHRRRRRHLGATAGSAARRRHDSGNFRN
jgi:hypothetical protein